MKNPRLFKNRNIYACNVVICEEIPVPFHNFAIFLPVMVCYVRKHPYCFRILQYFCLQCYTLWENTQWVFVILGPTLYSSSKVLSLYINNKNLIVRLNQQTGIDCEVKILLLNMPRSRIVCIIYWQGIVLFWLSSSKTEDLRNYLLPPLYNQQLLETK